MPGQKSNFQLLDKTGEKSTFSIPMGAITAVSLPGFLTEFGVLRDAIDAITLGNISKESWIGDDTKLTSIRPTDNFAQREMGLRIYMVGNNGGDEFHRTLATADLAQTKPADEGDTIALDTPQAVVDLVAAIEQIGRHPDDDQETITVTKIRIVGRNN